MGSSARQHARIKTLLNKINKEISNIPKYKGLTVKDSKGKLKQPNPAEAPLVAIGNAITAGRRALRFLKGKPSEKSLVKKADNLRELLAEAKQFKELNYSEDGKIVDYKGKEVKNWTAYTGLSRAEFLKKRDKAKKEKGDRPFFNKGGLATQTDYRKTGLFK